MSKPLFSRKIKCNLCGSNYKGKLQRKKRIYVCSGYDNYGKQHCERNIIHEEMIIELLDRRYGNEISTEEKVDKVSNISVTNKNKFKINLEDGEPIEFAENFIQF